MMRRSRRRRPPFDRIDLQIGPAKVHFSALGTSREPQLMRALEVFWRIHRDDLLADWETSFPGRRPWAWWAFDAREPMPAADEQAERRRLAELGEFESNEG